MSRPWKATDNTGAEVDLDNLATQNWLEGQSVGVENAAKRLNEFAAEEFHKREDKKAYWFRDVADMLVQYAAELKRCAEVHKKEHPYRNEET